MPIPHSRAMAREVGVTDGLLARPKEEAGSLHAPWVLAQGEGAASAE